MSELRTVKLHEMNAIKLGLRNDELYFKSEVDTVIAKLHKENEDLKNELFAVKTDLAMATRWRKCSEELPPNDGTVLISRHGLVGLARYNSELGRWWIARPYTWVKADYWMPIPKTPEAADGA